MAVSDIIAMLGGDNVVRLAIGAPLSTVNSWKRHNNVPEWRKHKLLELAVRKGVPLSTGDFPTKDQRIDPRKVA